MSENKNSFIKELITARGMKQADLAKAIAEKRSKDNDGVMSADVYKGIVSKWVNGDRDPGKEYLLDLSEILNVSVESLLRGKIIADKPENRPTAYAAAYTGDEAIIDRLFGNLDNYDIRVTTTDEYGKSFIEYAIEFNNYSAIKTAIDKKYCILTSITDVRELASFSEKKEIALLKMIVNADDIELFKKLYCRFSPIQNPEESNAYSFAQYYSIPYELCDSILYSKKVLKMFLEAKPFSNDERQFLYHGIYLDEETEVDQMPSLTPGFNALLARAIQLDEKEIINVFLSVASDYIVAIKDYCQKAEEENKRFNNKYGELIIDYDGGLRFKRVREVIAFVPVVDDKLNVQDARYEEIVAFNKKHGLIIDNQEEGEH